MVEPRGIEPLTSTLPVYPHVQKPAETRQLLVERSENADRTKCVCGPMRSQGDVVAEKAKRRRGWFLDEERLEQQQREREELLVAEMDASPVSDGFCYFIGCDEGLVKIGFSAQPIARLNRLKSDSLYKLSILALARGGRARETHYHGKFRAHAIGGEWFERCPEIEAEIERLNRPDQAQIIPYPSTRIEEMF